MKLAYKAEREKKTQKGVKGVSILSILIQLNFIMSMGLDTMHAVYSGAGKKLMELWFDISHKDEMFSLYQRRTEVDSYLIQIKHPNFCTRRARAITGNLSFFTTAEIKNWVMYFSIPILEQIMKPAHFEHYFLLVEAMFLLHQDSISQDDLLKAKCSLNEFVSQFELLYALQYMSFNVHSLLHLADVAGNLGPLSHSSCFALGGIEWKNKKVGARRKSS
jgi:hypothetical protein